MNAPPICIDRLLFPFLLAPPLPSTIRLRAVRPHAPLSQFTHHRAAVVALVGDHLARPLRVDLLYEFAVVGIRDYSGDALACFSYRLLNRRGISFIGPVQRDGDNGAGLHVHRMLGFVSQMRAAILHLGDARIGIVRMPPIIIRSLLRALAVQLRQLLARRRFDAALFCQPCQELFVALSGIAPHNRPQRRVGFQRGRVHTDRRPFQQFLLGQHPQHPLEH